MLAMMESAGGCEMRKSLRLGLPSLYIWTSSREKQINVQGWKWGGKILSQVLLPCMASILWVLAVKGMCGIYSCIGLPPDFLAQAFAITCIPHEGPSLNALSFLGYMNHWPNCCIDSYMPIDGSMVAIFCPSISLVWGQRVMPVSCGSLRVIFSGFMLDKFTACDPQSFKITGVYKQSWSKASLSSSDTSAVPLCFLSKLLSYETGVQIWGTRSPSRLLLPCGWDNFPLDLDMYMSKVIFEHVGGLSSVSPTLWVANTTVFAVFVNLAILLKG